MLFSDGDSQNVNQTTDEAEEWPSIKEVRGKLYFIINILLLLELENIFISLSNIVPLQLSWIQHLYNYLKLKII